MGIIELLLIAVGLSMDAFAVSICKGLGMRRVNMKHALIIALFFGGFQALMPLIGWAFGSLFEQYISQWDHWIAFALLGFIGVKMLIDAFKSDDEEDEECDCEPSLRIKEVFVLAIATSIDALAVGITFAFLQVNIVPAIVLIGVVTFLFSLGGVGIGSKFGSKYRKPATIVGGLVLIAIGFKILFEHLGIFG